MCSVVIYQNPSYIYRYYYHCPILQFLIYLFIGGIAACLNLFFFAMMYSHGINIKISAIIAFYGAAAINYLLCILILFRHKIKWKSRTEILFYIIVVSLVGALDLFITSFLFSHGNSAIFSKVIATGVILIFNFSGRRFIIFPEEPRKPWMPQEKMR